MQLENERASHIKRRTILTRNPLTTMHKVDVRWQCIDIVRPAKVWTDKDEIKCNQINLLAPGACPSPR